jgi:hypothetical protein
MMFEGKTKKTGVEWGKISDSGLLPVSGRGLNPDICRTVGMGVDGFIGSRTGSNKLKAHHSPGKRKLVSRTPFLINHCRRGWPGLSLSGISSLFRVFRSTGRKVLEIVKE